MDLPSIYILLVSFGIIQGNPSSRNPSEGSDSHVLALIHGLEKRVVFLEESRADDAKRMENMESELDDLKFENDLLRRHLFDQVHSEKPKKPKVAETPRKLYPFTDLNIDEITHNDIQNHTTGVETGENGDKAGNINRDQKTEKKRNLVSRRSGKESASYTGKVSTRVATHEVVSFHANLGTDVPSPASNRELVYDNVITNNGNSYSKNTGTFTCKEPGTYVFSWNTLTVYNHFADAHLMQNGVIMASTVSSSAYGRGSSTGVAVLHLDIGDEVWVKIGNRENGATIIMWSMFSGFKLNGYN